jgi:hypothetical protein
VNAAQVAAVLAKIQLGDNRETDAAGVVLAEWVDTIGDLDYQDAIEAVRMHRKSSTVYLQAAHIRENVRLIVLRRERELRVSSPRAIAANTITLDRPEFDRLTEVAIVAARAAKAVA